MSRKPSPTVATAPAEAWKMPGLSSSSRDEEPGDVYGAFLANRARKVAEEARKREEAEELERRRGKIRTARAKLQKLGKLKSLTDAQRAAVGEGLAILDEAEAAGHSSRVGDAVAVVEEAFD